MNAMLPQVTSADAGAVMERVVVHGDLSRLSPQERTTYYNAVCQSVGLNPLTRPFEYLRLNGKEILYAKKDATDQLRSIHGVSIEIVSKEVLDGMIVVTARAVTASGKRDEDMGAVPLPASGEARANAMMKALTKAKRRVTLSVCGLGFLDESEVESIAGAEVRDVPNMAAPPSGPLAQFQAPADEVLHILDQDGVEHAIKASKSNPAIMIWMSACRKALGKLEDAGAVREWRAAMGPHLAEIAATYPDEVASVEALCAARLEALAPPADEPAEADDLGLPA